MSVNPELIKLLSLKAGCDVSSHRGVNILCHDITDKTGEYISLNTLKRMTGILEYDKEHRIDILNVIASYLGFDSWSILDDYLQNKISEFNSSGKFINLVSLPDNKEVEISWNPDRNIVIKHRSGDEYEVIRSENSKLHVADLLYVSEIAVGFPFLVKQVVREGKSLGNYSAAMTEGLSGIRLL